MSCLFGYCGSPDDGLLAHMAALLAHRCPSGWERASGVTATGETVEIGHGMATWNRESQLARHGRDLLGYGGILFDHDGVTEPDDSRQGIAERLLAGQSTPAPCWPSRPSKGRGRHFRPSRCISARNTPAKTTSCN